MDLDDEEKLKCDAAYKVMRKKYPQFFRVLVTNEIPTYLYSEELIEEETMQKYTIREITDEAKARFFYQDIHRRVQSDYRVFEKMLEIIKEHGAKQEKLVQSLEDSFKDELHKAIKNFSSTHKEKSEYDDTFAARDDTSAARRALQPKSAPVPTPVPVPSSDKTEEKSEYDDTAPALEPATGPLEHPNTFPVHRRESAPEHSNAESEMDPGVKLRPDRTSAGSMYPVLRQLVEIAKNQQTTSHKLEEIESSAERRHQILTRNQDVIKDNQYNGEIPEQDLDPEVTETLAEDHMPTHKEHSLNDENNQEPCLACHLPRGQHYPSRGQHYPTRGQHYPTRGQHYPTRGQHYPTRGQHYPTRGQHYPTRGQHYPTRGQHCTTPLEDSTTPLEDSTTPLEDSTTPLEGSTTPLEDNSTPLQQGSAQDFLSGGHKKFL